MNGNVCFFGRSQEDRRQKKHEATNPKSGKAMAGSGTLPVHGVSLRGDGGYGAGTGVYRRPLSAPPKAYKRLRV